MGPKTPHATCFARRSFAAVFFFYGWLPLLVFERACASGFRGRGTPRSWSSEPRRAERLACLREEAASPLAQSLVPQPIIVVARRAAAAAAAAAILPLFSGHGGRPPQAIGRRGREQQPRVVVMRGGRVRGRKSSAEANLPGPIQMINAEIP
jgi:hypothetical protein